VAEPAGFREFVTARSQSLLRTAWMLTGDAASAEDLLQTALARTSPHWARIEDGSPEAYVRRVMVRTHASWLRRRWQGERPVDDVSVHESAGPDEHAAADTRVVLVAAVGALPLRQRQAVVLRYFDDLAVETVADLMGSSPGTVKSQCSKGLAKLKVALRDHALLAECDGVER
jgi:RNA polymerase sigma-70 factor (sigma-E family)